MKDKSQNAILCLLAAASAAIIAVLFCGGIGGNDFWWHVKVGEYIAQNGTIPATDVFSWIGVERSLPWTAHEWLSELIFYRIFSAAGEAGIFLLAVLSAVCMTGLILWQTGDKNCGNTLATGAFALLFSVLTSLFFYGRPHVFSFFLLFAELRILYRFRSDNNTKTIFFIPLIAVLWSNLHGGAAALSYILCALFLAAGACSFRMGRIEAERMDKKGLVRLGCVTLATVGGIFVNPVGAKVFLYPFQNLTDVTSMRMITEWAAPDAKDVMSLILYFCPIALVTMGMLASEKRIDIADIAVMGLFLLMFLRSARFIVLWYIAAAFYGLKYMPECSIKPVGKRGIASVYILSAIIAAAALWCGVAGAIKTSERGELIQKRVSQDVIDAVKEDGPKRIFNDYNLGGELIFHGVPVFFDARADLFAADGILNDGIRLMLLSGGEGTVEEAFEKYGFDSLLILKDRPLYVYAAGHPEVFETVFEDSGTAYFRVRKK